MIGVLYLLIYSKASNNAASYSADLATTRFLIGSKITWAQRFLAFFLEQRGFFEGLFANETTKASSYCIYTI